MSNNSNKKNKKLHEYLKGKGQEQDIITTDEFKRENSLYHFDHLTGSTTRTQSITYTSPEFLELFKALGVGSLALDADVGGAYTVGNGVLGIEVEVTNNFKTGVKKFAIDVAAYGAGVKYEFEMDQYGNVKEPPEGFVGASLIVGEQLDVFGLVIGQKGKAKLGFFIEDRALSLGYDVEISAGIIMGDVVIDEQFRQELLDIDEFKKRIVNIEDLFCFAAGTPVDMADGSQKPIEQIKIGDRVLAYDAFDRKGQGNLSARRVTRTYATPDKLVIDFHGLKVTPGHVFLCGDGEFAGEHRMLMEILRSDGTIVSAEGTVLRAATNAPVGSREDAFLQVAYLTDANDALMQSGLMRAGTLIFTAEGESKSVLDCLEAESYRFDAETGLVAKDGEEPHPLYWYGEIPRPEDYVLKRSDLTDADLYAEPGYRPEVAASEAPSRLGQGHTPSEGLLYAEAGKQAGETIH